MTNLAHIYRGKKILLTGHTGFKGAWLAEWLYYLGAEVTGFSLPPQTSPSLFDTLGLAQRLKHKFGNICDLALLRETVSECRPDFVFHLAAQSLVRLSYSEPVNTYATNVMGTVHVLEAVRLAQRPCVIVAVTTDKCYENREWLHGYREEDRLGGYDPYSSSKAAAELAVSAYRRSFFPAESGMRLASVRAGNVLGGGDWAEDRIVPDCIRALQQNNVIRVRNPHSTRPWQHVLDPLSGYLQLGAQMYEAGSDFSRARKLCDAFNFGPSVTSNRSVSDLVEEVLKSWPGKWDITPDAQGPHEGGLLNLSSDKAFHLLNWQSTWNFQQTVARTVNWYRKVHDGMDPRQVMRDDIEAHTDDRQAAIAS